MDTDDERAGANSAAMDAFSDESGDAMRPPPHATAPVERASLAVYALVGAAASAVPIPLVDAFLSGLARGSAMRRVAARRGVRLTSEARAILGRPGLASRLGTPPARLLRSAIQRALAPLRIASRIEDAIAIVLSALLLDHYLATADRRTGAPLGEREATIVRAAMERAWAEGGLEAVRTVPLGLVEIVVRAVRATLQTDIEGRNPIERFVDTLLDGAADAPEDLIQRMRDHFDAAIAARAAELPR